MRVFELGDIVEWQAHPPGGYRRGVIIGKVPPADNVLVLPLERFLPPEYGTDKTKWRFWGYQRPHEAYFVLEIALGRPQKKPAVYCPQTFRLQKVQG